MQLNMSATVNIGYGAVSNLNAWSWLENTLTDSKQVSILSTHMNTKCLPGISNPDELSLLSVKL